MVLHEIPLPAGENGAVGDEEVFRDLRIRDDDEELVAHEDREQRAKPVRPLVESTLGVLVEEGVAKERTGRNRVALRVGNALANKERYNEIKGGENNRGDGDVSRRCLQQLQPLLAKPHNIPREGTYEEVHGGHHRCYWKGYGSRCSTAGGTCWNGVSGSSTGQPFIWQPRKQRCCVLHTAIEDIIDLRKLQIIVSEGFGGNRQRLQSYSVNLGSQTYCQKR